MAFRLASIKTLAKLCTSSSSKTNVVFKNITSMTNKAPTLHYTQTRGIFWNDKKEGEKQAQTESAENLKNKTEETEQEQSNKETKTAEKAETKTQEASTKTQTTEKPQAAKQTAQKEAEQPFDVLLEDPTPENKKKIHALWKKLEKQAADKTEEVKKLNSINTALEQATNESKQKIDDLRSRLKEEIEERELMRKRFDKELDQSKTFAISKFAKDIIEVPDNLQRAIDASKALEGKEDPLFEGVKSTNNILMKTLARHGVVQINPQGEKFDPNFHEALFEIVDPNQTPGTCGMVATTGYLIGERVLRPAKVGVVKPPSKIEDKH